MTRPPRSPGNGGHQCRRDGDTDPGPVTAAVALLPASGQAAGQALKLTPAGSATAMLARGQLTKAA